MSSYSSLPASKDESASLHGPGGLLATPGMGTRRRWGKRTKGYEARAGGQIRGNLYRGGDGKFSSGPGGGGAAQRGIQLSKQPKPTARGAASAGRSGGKRGGKKGGATAKPRKQALTPEQKREQRAQEQAQNRADVLKQLNIAPDGQQALEALRSGQQPDADAIARGGFVEAGLVEQARDGSYRLTGAGRSMLSAADAGDVGRAGDTISGSRDRVGARQDRQAERAQKRAAREAALAKREQERAEAAKKKPSSGGGSSRQSTAPQPRADRSAEREQATQAALQASGLGADTFADLRTAAEQGGVSNRQLAELGLIGADGMTTDQGRRALSALEHGNIRQYQAALQDARARMERERATTQRASETQTRQIERRAWQHYRPRRKSFAVFKDARGAYRWIARTTTAYRDRDGEILSVDALDRDSQRMMATKQFGPLRWWHVGEPDPLNAAQPWGPGLDIGDCDYSVVIGRTRVESGTFRDPIVARKMVSVADALEMSPGFFHPVDQPGADGVFHQIRTFERSPVPTRYGRASNLFTGFAVKESRMDIPEMERRFKAMITELQLAPEQAQELAAGLIQTEKTAQQQGIAYKSEDVSADQPAPPDEIVLNGVTYTVKAAPPPPAAEAAPVDVAVETQDDGEMLMDDMGEMDGDVIGNMAPDAFAALIGSAIADAIAPLVKAIDITGKMAGQVDELKSMFGGVATKDDARAAEIATLKAQQQDLAAKLAALEGDQPAVTLPAEVEAALKSEGPQVLAQPAEAAPDFTADPSRPLASAAAGLMPELYSNWSYGPNGWQQLPKAATN